LGTTPRVPPRSGAGVSFAELRRLADGYDVLRIMIERVKDKVNAQNWSIGMKDEKAERDATCDEIEDFLAYPDKVPYVGRLAAHAHGSGARIRRARGVAAADVRRRPVFA